MKKTILNAAHRRLGATLVEFAGWEMPVSYSGILAEAQGVRQAAGLFDVSHMGVIEMTGPDARQELDRLVTCSIPDLPVGRARYGLLLNQQGGILDDLLLYALGPEHLWVIANASNAERDAAWIEAAVSTARVQRRFGEIAILALQGPQALSIAAATTGRDLSGLRRFEFAAWDLDGGRVLASRTGYTGEDGLEFFLPVENAVSLWERLLETGAERGLIPCGLGARDVLRMEAGNVLYGHEIEESTTPAEANLMWAVNLNKGDFIGRDALAAAASAPLKRRLTGLVMEDRAIPRQGMPIGTGDHASGVVTSGTFSPTLDRPIALGYLPPDEAVPQRPAWVEVRGKRRAARVAALPFVRRR